jgi:hypothetical protein
MFTLYRRVTPDEIQALTCESARLADLGASAAGPTVNAVIG